MKAQRSKTGRNKRNLGDGHCWPSRWELLSVVLILVVGVVLRVLYLGELAGMPEIHHPPVDEGLNLYWSQGLATGDWSLPESAGGRDPGIRTTAYLRPPGYAFVLAGILHLVEGKALAIRAFQMGLGLLSVILAWLIGRRLLGRAVGLIWAILMVINWPLLYFQGGLNGAWLLVLLSLVLAALLLKLAVQPTWMSAGLTGAVLGLISLVRPNALLFAPVLIVWGWWVLRRRGLLVRFLPMAFAAALAGSVVLVPSTVRNWRVEGTFAPISANGGLTLYHGNNDDAGGFSTSSAGGLGVLSSPWVIPDIVARLELELGRELTLGEASKTLGHRARVWMAENPGRAAGLVARKAALFWGPDEIAHNHVVGADRMQSPLLRKIPVGFSSSLGGAVVGLMVLVVWWRRGGASCPLRAVGSMETVVALGLFVVTWFVSFLPFFVASLYRVPIMPFLLLGSAVAVVEVGYCVRNRRQTLWAWLAALLLAVGLAHVPIVAADIGMARWHYDRGLAWIFEGQTEKAERSFLLALREDAGLQAAHNGLGKILLERGDRDGALVHFSKAATLRPKDPIARANRGLVLAQLGRWSEAEEDYEAALMWAPTNVDSWTNFGICRERIGNRLGAVEAYETALTLDGGHIAAANNLAWLLATAPEVDIRDGDRAVLLAEKVAAAGISASTLDTLAAALAEAGRYAEALTAADRALGLVDSSSAILAVNIRARRALFEQGRPFRSQKEIQ